MWASMAKIWTKLIKEAQAEAEEEMRFGLDSKFEKIYR
jgi:hypothetical protein